MLYVKIKLYFNTSGTTEQSVLLPTKYVLSEEEVGSLKCTVQSPLELGWDVKEQRPGRDRCHSIQISNKEPIWGVFILDTIHSWCFIFTFWWQTIKIPIPFRQIGSINSPNPGGIPLTVSQEYPPSGSRKGRWRSRLSSSWMSRPSLRIRLSAEASAAITTASIKSCSEDDKWIGQRKHFRKRSF